MFSAINRITTKFPVFNKPLPVAVKNQYIYKLKANSGYFCGLIVAQIIAVLFSLGGAATTSFGGGNININIHFISDFIIMFFSIVWSFVVGYVLTTQNQKNISFSVPCSRISDCLSDITCILSGCLFGGITTALLGAALRIPVYFQNIGKIINEGFYPSFTILAGVAIVTALYMLAAASISYFAGVLVQLSRIFYIIIPAVFFGTLLSLRFIPQIQLSKFWNIVLYEKPLGLLTLTCITFAAITFALAALISNQLEVRK